MVGQLPEHCWVGKFSSSIIPPGTHVTDVGPGLSAGPCTQRQPGEVSIKRRYHEEALPDPTELLFSLGVQTGRVGKRAGGLRASRGSWRQTSQWN